MIPVALREVGGHATRFFEEQLELSRQEFGGILARRMEPAKLRKETWLFAPAEVGLDALDWEGGGWGFRSVSDRSLGRAVQRWLDEPNSPNRVLAQEDPLAMPADPWLERAQYSVRVCGEKIIWWAAGSTPVDQVLGRASGYPGIGVLAEGVDTCLAGQLSESGVDELISASVLVLVRALDDEGFLLKGVEGQRDVVAELARLGA